MCLFENKTLYPHIHTKEAQIWTQQMRLFENKTLYPYIHTKGAQIWTQQKENNAEWRERFILKQIRFSVNDKQQHGNILTLRSSAVQRFSNSKQFPENGQGGPKQVAINVISILF
jgi:hypothetical protein